MRRTVRAIPLVIVYALIIYFSVKTPSGRPANFPYMDKLGHFIAYFTLGFTILLSIKHIIARSTFLVISLGLGIILEFIQGQLSYRYMSFEDGVSNFLGLLGGVIFYLIFRKQIIWIISKTKLEKFFLQE